MEKTDAIFSGLNIPKDSLIHQYKWTSQGFAGRFNQQQVDKLRKHPLIEHVAKDVYSKAIDFRLTSKPMRSSKPSMSSTQTTPWGISRINAPLSSSNNTAWIIDSGIDVNHDDLNVDQNRTVSFLTNEGTDDLNGHGTHVAGTIAAINNNEGVIGVAPGTQVVGVKVCDQNGYCWTSDVKAGVDYVANNFSAGDVANISLGYETDEYEPRKDIAYSILENSITTAANAGLQFAIAAGNDSKSATLISPARVNHSNVWTVSAYDENDVFASFSNYGNPPIEYSAPGVNILSLWKNNGTNTIQGTSMAAPHIAGLLLAAPLGIDTDGTVLTDPDGNSDPIAVAAEPEPTLTVSVSGPQFLNSGQSGTWSASVSYNDGPVSYEWFRRESPSDPWSSTNETSSSYTTYFYNGSSTDKHAGVKVEVSSAGENDSAGKSVIVSSSDCDPLLTTEGDITPNAPDPCY